MEESTFYVNNKGEFIEEVDFGEYKVEYDINGIKEHDIFGIYFHYIHN